METMVTTEFDQNQMEPLSQFLKNNNLPETWALKLYEVWGPSAVNRFTTSPYSIFEKCHSFPFPLLDDWALKHGAPQISKSRFRAGILWLLKIKLQTEQSYVCITEFIDKAIQLLNTTEVFIKVEIRELIAEHILTIFNMNGFECLSFFKPQKAYKELLSRLAQFQSKPPALHLFFDLNRELLAIEKKNSIRFTSSQKLAIHTSMTNSCTFIDGEIESGKSLVVRALTSLFDEAHFKPLIYNSKTIYEKNPLNLKPTEFIDQTSIVTPTYSILVIYNAHLITLDEFLHLLKAHQNLKKLICIGDSQQCSHFEAGHIFRNLANSKQFPTIRMHSLQKRVSASKRLLAIQKIQNHELPDLIPHRLSDFFFLDCKTENALWFNLKDLIQNRLPKTYSLAPIIPFQIITASTNGPMGTSRLNRQIQALRQTITPSNGLSFHGYQFYEGDKILLFRPSGLRPRFGMIESIDLESQTLKISGDPNTLSEIPSETQNQKISFNNIHYLKLSYATTIEQINHLNFPFIILLIPPRIGSELTAHHLYISLSLAQKMTLFLGSKTSLKEAINSISEVQP